MQRPLVYIMSPDTSIAKVVDSPDQIPFKDPSFIRMLTVINGTVSIFYFNQYDFKMWDVILAKVKELQPKDKIFLGKCGNMLSAYDFIWPWLCEKSNKGLIDYQICHGDDYKGDVEKSLEIRFYELSLIVDIETKDTYLSAIDKSILYGLGKNYRLFNITKNKELEYLKNFVRPY